MEELRNLLTIPESDLEVLDWLGGGSTTAVFKGLWRNDGEAQEVAIKKMKIFAEDVSEVCREIKTMLNHSFENVCKLYGGCVADGGRQVWLAMEYADGGDLHFFLRRCETPLTKDIQLSLCIQATKAVAALHNAPYPILHRDIKSLSFLVQNNSKLLLDFGIAKVRSTTAETFTVGTVRWMAPEIVSTSKGYSDKSDIFSLGMVFYEIINGEFPYNDEGDANMTQILDKIKRGVLPKLPAECPKEWAKLIQRCWSFKPEKRPNANELLAIWATVEAGDNHNQNEDKKKSKKDKSPLSSPKSKKKQLAVSSPPSLDTTITPANLSRWHSDSEAITRAPTPGHSRKHKKKGESLHTSIEGAPTLEPQPTRTRSFSMNDTDRGEKGRGKGFHNFFSSLSKASGKIFGKKKDKRREADTKSEAPALNAVS